MAIDFVQGSASVDSPSTVSNATDVLAMAESDGTRVVVGMGSTKNMGNYESARFNVSIEVPCTSGTKDESFYVAKTWCMAKMEELMGMLEGGGD